MRKTGLKQPKLIMLISSWNKPGRFRSFMVVVSTWRPKQWPKSRHGGTKANKLKLWYQLRASWKSCLSGFKMWQWLNDKMIEHPRAGCKKGMVEEMVWQVFAQQVYHSHIMSISVMGWDFDWSLDGTYTTWRIIPGIVTGFVTLVWVKITPFFPRVISCITGLNQTLTIPFMGKLSLVTNKFLLHHLCLPRISGSSGRDP